MKFIFRCPPLETVPRPESNSLYFKTEEKNLSFSLVDKYTNLGSPEPTPPPRFNRLLAKEVSVHGTRPRRERSTSIVDEALRRNQESKTTRQLKFKDLDDCQSSSMVTRDSNKPRKVSFYGITDEEQQSIRDEKTSWNAKTVQNEEDEKLPFTKTKSFSSQTKFKQESFQSESKKSVSTSKKSDLTSMTKEHSRKDWNNSFGSELQNSQSTGKIK